MKKPCAIGAAILVAAIGVGLALMNRFAGGDGDDVTPGQAPDGHGPLESTGKGPAPTAEPPATSSGPGAQVGPSMTKAELYEVASDLGIKGRSSMNKAQLIEAIRAAS